MVDETLIMWAKATLIDYKRLMKHFKKPSLLILAPLTFVANLSCAQNWKKETLNKKQDSLFAIYSWEEHDEVHGAGEKIVLTKQGRFKYSGYWPLHTKKFAEGSYSKNNNTITLNSDLQSDNIKVAISYIDKISTDTSYSRLSFPKNNKGESIYKSYYHINYDTTFKNSFDPLFPFNINLTHSIKCIKVQFYDAGFGSPWIPIEQNNKFIAVKIITNQNFDDYKPEVLKNWKFKIYKNRLIDLTAIPKHLN